MLEKKRTSRKVVIPVRSGKIKVTGATGVLTRVTRTLTGITGHISGYTGEYLGLSLLRNAPVNPVNLDFVMFVCVYTHTIIVLKW